MANFDHPAYTVVSSKEWNPNDTAQNQEPGRVPSPTPGWIVFESTLDNAFNLGQGILNSYPIGG